METESSEKPGYEGRDRGGSPKKSGFRPLKRSETSTRTRSDHFHLQSPSWRPPQAGDARGFARASDYLLTARRTCSTYPSSTVPKTCLRMKGEFRRVCLEREIAGIPFCWITRTPVCLRVRSRRSPWCSLLRLPRRSVASTSRSVECHPLERRQNRGISLLQLCHAMPTMSAVLFS